MSRWFRHYAGLCRDEKLVGVAIKAKQPVERVVWVWAAILESASEIDDGGRYALDPAEAAYFLRADEDDIRTIENALSDSGRLDAGFVVKWGNRQFQSDRSKERVAAHRERKRSEDIRPDTNETSRNGDVTLQKRHCNSPETDTETETNKKDRNARARVSLFKEFDEFWLIYPRRTGDNRHGANKSFEKAVKAGSDPQVIIAGARRFAAAMAGQDRQFIKGAAVWLNNRCWLDDFAPVGPNVLPFGTADPPRRQLSEAEQAERARKFNEDYAAGRI